MASTPHVRRTVYRRASNGELVDPKLLDVWVPAMDQMYTKIGVGPFTQKRPVHVDEPTTRLYYEDRNAQ